MAIIYPQCIPQNNANTILAVSSQISAITGSTCSIEPQNTRSSNVQNPNYCELLAALAVSNNDILPVLAVWMSSIGPWNTVSQYSQCLQYCPPKISQMLSSVYVRHSRSILEALRVYQVQYLQYRTPKYSEFKRTGSEVLRVTRSNGSIEQWHLSLIHIPSPRD